MRDLVAVGGARPLAFGIMLAALVAVDTTEPPTFEIAGAIEWNRVTLDPET